MLVVGLTGGVGSGKSTAARLLAAHGAVVVDTDVIAREVVSPGTVGLEAVAAHFGDSFLRPDGTLDRAGLAELVFANPAKLAELNRIVHPLVRAEATRRLAELGNSGDPAVAVLVVPLWVESGHYQADVVVVVDAPEEVALGRVMEQRGWTEAEARKRMAAQASRTRRLAAADIVIENDGHMDHLQSQIDVLWKRLTASP